MRSDFPVVVITSGFQNIKPLLFHNWPVHTGTTQKQNLQQVMAIFSEWGNAATFDKLE